MDYYQTEGAGHTGEDDEKGKNTQSLLPVTIRQLETAQQGPDPNSFSIDGKKLYRAKGVGQIMSINRLATAINIELDDGTGRIDTRFWLMNESEEDDSETSDWQEGVYVRVFGHLRQFKNTQQHSFVAVSIQPIQDYNEITFHFLEAIYVHLTTLNAAQDPMSYSSYNPQTAIQNPYASQGTEDTNDLEALHATVRDIVVRHSNTTEGASFDMIVQEMEGYGVDASQVQESINYLSGEGHIYPTFDEHHFKA